jgi:Flp pilus assembly protein protease CpaA
VTDIAVYRIKNSILVLSSILFLSVSFRSGQTLDLPYMLGPPVIVFAFLFPFFLLHIIKAGDIKLLMVSALYLGLSGLIDILLYTAAASAALIMICMKVRHTSLLETRFPFAFALFLGAYPIWRF